MLVLRVSYNICWECAFVYITPAPFCSNNLTLIILPLNWHSSIKIWNHIKWFRYLCCEVAFCSTLWTARWISSKLAQILIWDSQIELLDFDDLNLIYKVTRDIYKKTCLYPIFLTNDQIFTKLTQITHWEDLNEWLEFGKIDLNSKITSVTYLL